MWRFKPFAQKEQTGLEGRTIDIGNVKVHVRNIIAEGGFSCVYLARDALHMSRQFALKHMICNDEESLGVAMNEISVMKSLAGHPNVVALHAHTVLDMGRTKEVLLLMDFCEKSLVSVLESRGAAHFEEKQILVMFRDVCNAVFAMHCQSPPVAHRDLKAENLLLGTDGLWKLCDFGSTSTNHKRFEKPEEMGIEEDNIRKHTTPAYRAPEMWDLFRKEVLNEKVDIWALGCLLFRICYLKSAFDGESKLQILNGNYRIPELPKYSSFITDLINDMLQASPDDRPDITQVWFRVNEQLPVGQQKSLPDRPPEMQPAEIHEGIPKSTNRVSPVPRRSPPPPPSYSDSVKSSPHIKAGGSGGQLGAFWSSLHAKDSVVGEDNTGPHFDEEPTSHRTSKLDREHAENHTFPKNAHPKKEVNVQPQPTRRSAHGQNYLRPEGNQHKDFEINFFQKDSDHGNERPGASKPENAAIFQDNSFNTFVAEFDTKKFGSGIGNHGMQKEEDLEVELERLKEHLKQANLEKTEITSKYEKLSAICRSQRQEIQELKQALAARAASPSRDDMRNQTPTRTESSAAATPLEEARKTNWDIRQEKVEKHLRSSEPTSWQAFADDPKPRQPLTRDTTAKSVRMRNGQQSKQGTQAASNYETWGFGSESFTAMPNASSQMSKPIREGSTSQRFGDSKFMENKSSSQPAGWAGF
ncbi:AP2-associated protein kinase 1 [Rhodamnia argentea]|uniref:non-specific serine/threonine protein kinase n=1 Tax=Rhodamnia argentea TaxID=178133 RepID=A0A8B8PJW2_9MYRT|nr:AP2-associated protein kinase 1 [Rhodamnia argentea]XP_048128268.1 AP2-associated protein kinase 1 [Rhodamnia argentea]